MTARKFYTLLALVMGYGLIIGGWLLFKEHLEQRVMILNIVASCMIFTQFAMFGFFRMIDLDKPAQREVGMMGIHYTGLNLCCIFSVAVMAYGIAYDLPFKFQLMGQLGILMLLILFRIFTLTAGEKVEEIYHKEERIKEGKALLSVSMADFMDEVATVSGLDAGIHDRLKTLHENVRFITPSDKTEATMLDTRIVNSLDELTVLMRDVQHNSERIAEEVGRLERTFARRKQLRN